MTLVHAPLLNRMLSLLMIEYPAHVIFMIINLIIDKASR